ncbi:hypothetical protein ACQ4LE_005949 [Meloidogyne hapla]
MLRGSNNMQVYNDPNYAQNYGQNNGPDPNNFYSYHPEMPTSYDHHMPIFYHPIYPIFYHPIYQQPQNFQIYNVQEQPSVTNPSTGTGVFLPRMNHQNFNNNGHKKPSSSVQKPLGNNTPIKDSNNHLQQLIPKNNEETDNDQSEDGYSFLPENPFDQY